MVGDARTYVAKADKEAEAQRARKALHLSSGAALHPAVGGGQGSAGPGIDEAAPLLKLTGQRELQLHGVEASPPPLVSSL